MNTDRSETCGDYRPVSDTPPETNNQQLTTNNSVPETRPTSWSELNQELYADAWQERLGRFRLSWAFRGMSSSRYDLTTSLARLGGSPQLMEEHMLRAFQKYASRHMLSSDSVWNWLALAQHHGLSTRLLDWTYSPLVAMHFATASPRNVECDGVIWAVNYAESNRLLPQRLKDVLQEEGSDVFTVDMLARSLSSLRDFDRLADEAFVAFFEPPSLDDRIINQYALFSLVSDPGLSLDDWLAQHPSLCRRIIMPTELKQEVRDKLDQANITERMLYPGLDGLCAWLNRYYTPRREEEQRPKDVG